MRLEKQVLGYPIQAEINQLDCGWDIGIYGGCSTHVGAVTLAEPDRSFQTMEREHHKDSFVSRCWATITASCDEMLQDLILVLKQERKDL